MNAANKAFCYFMCDIPGSVLRNPNAKEMVKHMRLVSITFPSNRQKLICLVQHDLC